MYQVMSQKGNAPMMTESNLLPVCVCGVTAGVTVRTMVNRHCHATYTQTHLRNITPLGVPIHGTELKEAQLARGGGGTPRDRSR